MMKLQLAVAVFSAFLMPTAASATTYAGSFSATVFESGSGLLKANYTITTDGTIGILAYENLVKLTLSVDYNGVTVENTNNFIDLVGHGASATLTEILFDFGSPTTLLFSDGNIGMCLSGSSEPCFNEPQTSSLVYNLSLAGIGWLPRSTGVETIATVVSGVPEPANWAMLIAGFGATGAVMRRRKVVVV
jgi:hypothetical protein